MNRLSISAVLTALFLSACATAPTGRPPQPPSSPTMQSELGYREVIQAGAEYARMQGYALADKSEAVEVRPNYWRLRFGLADKHSGQWLSLEFDGASRSVVHEEVVPESLSDPGASLSP